MSNKKYQAKKISSASKIKTVEDVLVLEEALKISINNEIFTITMRTPDDDKELITGLLFSEDVYNNKGLLQFTFSKEDAITNCNVNIKKTLLKKGFLNSRSMLSVASCGICGKTQLDTLKGKIKDTNKISLEKLNAMFSEMNKNQDLFIKSGGSHAATIFDNKNNLLSLKEDIGRHNAVDKTIGDLLIQNKLKDAFCLLVSGRVSYEIIIKAFRAKIPVLASVSAPSSLAVDFAKELGITLLGFCREEKATCYANCYRVVPI